MEIKIYSTILNTELRKKFETEFCFTYVNQGPVEYWFSNTNSLFQFNDMHDLTKFIKEVDCPVKIGYDNLTSELYLKLIGEENV